MAKNINALNALNAITSATGGMTQEERKAAALERNKEKLATKLEVLKLNGFLRKGKRPPLSMRAALVQFVIAANYGATREQLDDTEVAKRFPWAKVAEAVLAYAHEKADDAKLVCEALGVEYKELEKAPEPEAAPEAKPEPEAAEDAPEAKPSKSRGRKSKKADAEAA